MSNMRITTDQDGVSLHIELDEPPKELDENDSLAEQRSEDDDDEDGMGERGAWGGKLEFIFTCIGYAVGLGNVWRFPYLCYKNGGGAFLLPYVLMLCSVGLPLFFMELSFGQFASLGPITVWKVNRTLKGLGYAMVSVSWLLSVYYNVIIAHVLLFLFASLAAIPTHLPWISCDNWWNTPNCIGPVYREDTINNTLNLNNTLNSSLTNSNIYNIVTTIGEGISKGDNILEQTTTSAGPLGNFTGKPQTAAEEYYAHFVLEQSDGMETPGPVNYKVALCLLLAWFIVFCSLIKGIQSLGKVVYFTAIFPYMMLFVMLIRSVTLPGSVNGIIYYLYPDFSRLSDPRVWSDAATQIFYSLGTCSGGLIAMSSYNKFNNNCLRDALIVSSINCLTSILAGFVIFAVLGFMAMEKGVEVSDVAAGGPGLAFVVYPEALSRMPGSQFWAISFFVMMATLGFGSQLSFVETVLSAFTDEFAGVLRGKYPSIIFRVSVIIFTFLMGLPMCTTSGIYLLNLVDYSLSGFPLLVVGLLEVIALNWIYGFKRFSEDIEIMLGYKPNIYWQICWKGVTPTIILITIGFNMFVYKPPSLDHYLYPQWAQNLGWLIGMFPVSLVVLFFFWSYCRKGGSKLLHDLSEPKSQWGPALPSDRQGRYASHETQTTGTQSDFSTMWTQTRIILARTPMPSSLNLHTGGSGGGGTSGSVLSVGTPCTIPLCSDPDDIISAVQQSRAAAAMSMVDAAAGTEDEPFLLPVSGSAPAGSAPIAIPRTNTAQSGLPEILENIPMTTLQASSLP